MNGKTSSIETTSPGQPAGPHKQPVKVWHGLIFAFLGALAAEGLLGTFVFLSADPLYYASALGRLLSLAFGLYIVHHFSVFSFRRYKPALKDLACLSSILIGSVVLLWLSRLIAVSIAQYLSALGYFGALGEQIFYFGIPFATGGLLLQSILGLHYGMVFAVGLALITAIYFPGAHVLPVFVIASSLVACLSLSHFRSRSAYIRAGFNVSLVAAACALFGSLEGGTLTTSGAAIGLVAALLGGVLCAFIASGVAPVVEHLGGYVTDMRLLEMATLDHPLLKELSVQAPGTWNHCMVMGMMVEAAAQGVNANPVLARVGAYFHDIGKIKKPVYFVENQGGEENRHNKLSTSMSALIIRTHVKDGIELARKHGLPKALEDMIPQHHGTSRIEYFFEKARKELEESGGEAAAVDESLYRYPGPKPQTREAGILMLADGIEAAARTLTDPTYDRIQGMVQKMINKVFASGELDECDLTLKDLHVIAKSFTRVLSGIYHQRIAYAEPAEKVKTSEDEAPQPNGEQGASAAKEVASGDSGKKKAAGEDKLAKTGGKENLKRLGL